MINSLVLSKVWYSSHTYPLPKKYSNQILKEIFEYLWQSKLNRIKREVIYQSKTKGGLDILNVYLKAKSILTSTFLKHFLTAQENDSLLKYFCGIRLNPIFNIRELPTNLSFTSPWYFNDIIDDIRTCLHLRKFPNINSNDIYSIMLPECKPTVTEKHNLNWKQIWKQTTFKYISVHEREVIYKFIHGILPNKMRLYQMKQNRSPLCPTCNVIEDNSHMFIKCRNIENILNYFKYILNIVCNICNVNVEKIIFLDIKTKTKKELNTATVLIVNYVATIWYNRNRNIPLDPLLLKTNVLKHQKLLSLVLMDNMQKVFTEKYCKFEFNI